MPRKRPPRRDPFARLKQPLQSTTPGPDGAPPAPPTILDLIPRAKRRERKREWEKANRAKSYKIPTGLHDRARNIRSALLGLAEQYQTTADEVAAALMTAALDAVAEGDIRLEFVPNPQGRKMRVEVVREGGWPQEDLPKPRKRSKAAKPVFLGFRWSNEIDRKITEVAANAKKGEVVVLLLEAALERLKAGQWGLRPRTVTVKQGVSVDAGEREGGGLAEFRGQENGR